MQRLYRKILNIYTITASKLRIVHLRLKYPDITISWKSYIGRNCRIVCVKNSTMQIKNVYISDNCTIFSDDNATLKMTEGFIGVSSVIVARKKIIIEPHFSIAEMVVIRDQNHKYDLSDNPLKGQGYESDPIIIGSNVWIASKATILKGVKIGENAVIGAHSVVNKNVAPNSLVAGVPANLIKMKN